LVTTLHMKIGDITTTRHPIFLAPMHEVTDTPFRLACKRLGADVMISEFVSVEALIRHVDKAKKKMRIDDTERPVGIQIFGKNVESFEAAVPIVESFRPDFIDINAGCSAGKHASRGECAGLLRDLPLFEKIVRATVKNSHVPVTVKTRLGWDQDSLVILEAAKMIEDTGAQALTVHCRTRRQSYKHPADWSWLSKIKKTITIPLIGNGDVTTPQDVRSMFETGCDGVMIGRGALHNPWIFREARFFLETGRIADPVSLTERIETCRCHLRWYTQYHRQESALYAFRKFYTGYLKGLPGIAGLRKELMALTDCTAIEECLTRFLTEQERNDDVAFS